MQRVKQFDEILSVSPERIVGKLVRGCGKAGQIRDNYPELRTKKVREPKENLA
jgi:hypothetical protein